MNTFFVDTNFFLQCRDPAELAWRDVASDDDVMILVPRVVQREIDRLKQSGSSRRAKRARKASSLFRQIIESDDLTFMIRDAAPRLLISFSPPLNSNQERSAVLDLTQPDDRIINEALEYVDKYPEKNVRFLTHDTNPMLTAKYCGLPYAVIPDTWLLQPETDDRDKEIAEIKRRLGVLEKDLPQIEVSVHDRAGGVLSQLEIDLITFSELSSGEEDQLVSELCLRYPMATQFGNEGGLHREYEHLILSGHAFLGNRYEPPTDDEIRHYREVGYPGWVESVRKFLTSLPTKLELSRRRVAVTFTLNNEGVCPAENVDIEFKSQGGLLFMPRPRKGEAEDENCTLSFPAPPKPPAGRHVSLATLLFGAFHPVLGEMPERPLGSMLPSLGRLERDPHAFYRNGERTKDYSDVLAYTCEEFRHKVDTKSFNLSVFVPSNVTATNGLVTCQVTARNLPEPLVKKLPVRISYEKGDVLTEARRLTARVGRR